MSTRMIPTLSVFVPSAAASCWGQESRGSITGKVTDPQGAMIPGATVVTETVQVTAAAPLLDTTAASGGRVIDNRQVMQLPFNDLNPFVLTALRADAIRNWDFKILRQFRITERLNTNFSADLLNATNHTSKTFGMVTSQRGVSRVLHFNLRIDL